MSSKPATPEQLGEWLQKNGRGVACPNCQHRLGSLAKFCNQCGTAMPEPANPIDLEELAQHAEHIKFQCSKLGHMMQQGMVKAKFCTCCGTNLLQPGG